MFFFETLEWFISIKVNRNLPFSILFLIGVFCKYTPAYSFVSNILESKLNLAKYENAPICEVYYSTTIDIHETGREAR